MLQGEPNEVSPVQPRGGGRGSIGVNAATQGQPEQSFLNLSSSPLLQRETRQAASLQDFHQPRLRVEAFSLRHCGAVALAVACALSALLARGATRPIDALTKAAERLEAGDYSVDVPPASTTELSRLASAFNAMRTAVADREATIRHQA